jgi:hypothetical protein
VITFGTEAVVLDWAEGDERVLQVPAVPVAPSPKAKPAALGTLTGSHDPGIDALASCEKPVQGGRWRDARETVLKVAHTIVEGAGGKRGAEIVRRFSRCFVAIASRAPADDLVPVLLAVHQKHGSLPDDATCGVLERLAADSASARTAVTAFVAGARERTWSAADARRLQRLAKLVEA